MSVDLTWTITGVVVGVVAIIVSIVFFYRSKIRRILDWSGLGILPVVRQPVNSLNKKLALTYDGEPLTTPYLCRVRILNPSGLSVTFNGDEEVTLDFGEGRSCYEAFISDASPLNRKLLNSPLIDRPCSVIKYQPPTQYRGEWLDIDMIVESGGVMEVNDLKNYPHVSSVFTDQTRPMVNVVSTMRRRRTRLGLIGIMIGTTISLVPVILLGIQGFPLPESVPVWVLNYVAAGMIMAIASMLFITGERGKPPHCLA